MQIFVIKSLNMKKNLLSILATICYLQYFAQIPTNGLVSSWNFSTGRAIDAIQPKITATEANISTANDHFNNPGAAYVFNGGSTNSHVNLGNSPKLNFSTGLTISAWINHNGGGEKAIISKWANSMNLDQYILFINSNNRVQFAVGSPGNSANGITSSGSLLSTFQWYHIVATWDTSGRHTIYINGVQNTSTVLSNFKTINQSTVSVPVYIGTQDPTAGTRNMKGSIDDVKLYNRALTLSEVQSLYNEPNPIVNGLVSYYPFDMGTTDLKDTLNYNDAIGTNVSYATDRNGNGNSCLDIAAGSTHLNLLDSYDNFSADVNDANNRKISYSFWVNFKTIPSGTNAYQIILAKSADAGCSGNDRQFLLRINNSGKIQLDAYGTLTSGNSITAVGSSTLSASQWYHVVLTYNHLGGTGVSKFNLFLNGNQETLSQTATAGSGMNVGMQNGASCIGIGTYLKWDGSICSNVQRLDAYLDELRIYNKVLSQAEVTTLYGNTTTGINNQIQQNSNIEVYPNPVTNTLHIDIKKATDVVIINLLGEVLHTEKLNIGSNLIDTHNFKQGVYFIQMSDGKTAKFIKE